MNDKEDFRSFYEIMIILADNFSVPLTDKNVEVRFNALKGYPIELVRKAAGQIIKTRCYNTLPAVADFIEFLEPHEDDAAETQAQLVYEALKTQGAWNAPKFEDPTTNDVINKSFGGWKNLCRSTLLSEIKWFFRDFKNAYIEYNKNHESAVSYEQPQEIPEERKKLLE